VAWSPKGQEQEPGWPFIPHGRLHGILGIRIENQRCKEKEEQQEKLPPEQGGRHPARFSRRIAWSIGHVQPEPNTILALPQLSTQSIDPAGGVLI
jgi:hypothetical protein